jgi:two-component system response regulator YesN
MALEIIKNNQIDLLITDIKMFGMNGIELIAKAKGISPYLKTIILSGYAEFEYANDAIKLGVDGYLLKPVNIGELLQLTGKLLNHENNTVRNQHVRIYDDEDKASGNSSRPVSLLVKKCMAYIEENYQKNITLHSLAEKFERNPSYISHIFNKEIGINLSEYINQIRINHAISILNSSNMLLYEVAQVVGFNDYRYFISVFKKLTGLSPTDYCKSSDSMKIVL